MAEMNEIGIPGIGTGILQPQLINQFRVIFGGVDKTIAQQLALQVIDCKMNFVKKTVNITIEQPAVGGAMMQFLSEWIADRTNTNTVSDHVSNVLSGFIRVQGIDGGEGIVYSARFNQLYCISHQFDLDYAGRGAAHHHIQFVFGSMIMEDLDRFKTVAA